MILPTPMLIISPFEARRLKNPNYEVEAHCDLVFCLCLRDYIQRLSTNYTLFTRKELIPMQESFYYTMASRLYYDVSDYTTEPYQSQYVKQAGIYTDSLLHYLPADSTEWLYAVGDETDEGTEIQRLLLILSSSSYRRKEWICTTKPLLHLVLAG